MSIDVFKALQAEQKLADEGSPLSHVPCVVCESNSTCDRECTYFDNYVKCNSAQTRKMICRSLITDAAMLTPMELTLKKFPQVTQHQANIAGEKSEETVSRMPRGKVLHGSLSRVNSGRTS